MGNQSTHPVHPTQAGLSNQVLLQNRPGEEGPGAAGSAARLSHRPPASPCPSAAAEPKAPASTATVPEVCSLSRRPPWRLPLDLAASWGL